jgi:hypothetical protein
MRDDACQKQVVSNSINSMSFGFISTMQRSFGPQAGRKLKLPVNRFSRRLRKRRGFEPCRQASIDKREL